MLELKRDTLINQDHIRIREFCEYKTMVKKCFNEFLAITYTNKVHIFFFCGLFIDLQS